jgi:hypothetical protein
MSVTQENLYNLSKLAGEYGGSFHKVLAFGFTHLEIEVIYDMDQVSFQSSNYRKHLLFNSCSFFLNFFFTI